MAHSPTRDFANPALPPTPTKAWNLASVAVVAVAIFIFLNILTLRGFGATKWGLLAATTALCLFGLVHVRFLSVAQGQSREAHELLVANNRQLQCLYENALNPILIFDSNGICQDASPSCSVLLGSHHNKVMGQAIRAFYANSREFDSFWKRLLSQHRFQGEAELVRADGMTVFAEFTVTRHVLPNRHLMILRDITERRRTQQALHQSLILARSSSQEADALRRATVALTGDRRMDSSLRTLLETVARFVPYEQAQVFVFENAARLFLAHESAPDPGQASDLGLPETVELSEFPMLAAVLERQEGMIVEDASEVGMCKRHRKGSRVRSWMGVPIYSSNQALGILLLTHSSPAVFSRDHLRLSRSLASSAAVAIQTARLYERVEICAEELKGRPSEARPVQQTKRPDRERGTGISENWFKKVFRSAPVAMSVASIPTGRFIEVNEAFERRFGFEGKSLFAGTIEEFRFCEDAGAWHDLIERLRCSTTVRREVARLRTKSGAYEDVRFSAEAIDLEGQACLLLVAEDAPDLTTSSAQI